MQVSNKIIAATAAAATAAAGLVFLFYMGWAGPPVRVPRSSYEGLNTPLGTSATDVSCASALQRVLPSGWQVEFTRKPPVLCRSISWHRRDTPWDVEQGIAMKTGLEVLPFYDRGIVMFGSWASIEKSSSRLPVRLSTRVRELSSKSNEARGELMMGLFVVFWLSLILLLRWLQESGKLKKNGNPFGPSGWVHAESSSISDSFSSSNSDSFGDSFGVGVNPASGLPMQDDTVDIGGNPYGMDSGVSDSFSSSSSDW